MNRIVIEGVPIAELPQAWRDQLDLGEHLQVTVRTDAESASEAQDPAVFSDDPSFGMWRDRHDMADVAGYIRRIRAPRFTGNTTVVEVSLPDELVSKAAHAGLLSSDSIEAMLREQLRRHAGEGAARDVAAIAERRNDNG